MAKYGKCDFDGLKELQKKMEKFQENELDKFVETCAKELAARLLAKVIKRTPVQSGTLRRGWTMEIKRQGDTYVIEIMNPVEYASYVEYGHRQEVGRYVPALGKRLKKGWVRGHFMLTISEKEIRDAAPKILEKKLQKKLEEIFK